MKEVVYSFYEGNVGKLSSFSSIQEEEDLASMIMMILTPRLILIEPIVSIKAICSLFEKVTFI